jgi:predicted  nucleic acid-binding Zn-ribbon protein
VELLSTLLNRGDLVRCPSCGVILYLEEDLRESHHHGGGEEAEAP